MWVSSTYCHREGKLEKQDQSEEKEEERKEDEEVTQVAEYDFEEKPN
jgi:hypothetical protein